MDKTFTIREIDRAVVEKIIPEGIGFDTPSREVDRCHVFNNAIDAQSSVKLQWKREKLIDVLKAGHSQYWDEDMHAFREVIEEIADAIINTPINELLEVVE